VAEQEKIDQLEEKVKELEKRLSTKEKICEILTKRVERSIDSVGGAYSIFERNILLQHLVDQRSRELEDANKELSQEINERIKSEQKLHSVIQGSPIPAFVIGKDHRVLYWNKALEELSSIKADEVIGTRQHWRAFYSKGRPCMADLLVDEILEAIPRWYSGKYIKSKLIEGAYEAIDFFPELGDGGKWLHFTAASIRDSQGDLVGAIESLEDITERKRAEEVLKSSEEKYRNLVESTSEAILVRHRGIIEYANPAAVELFGASSDADLIGKPNLDFIHPDDRADSVERLKRNEESLKVPLREHRIVTLDGKVIHVESVGIPFAYGGRLLAYGMFRDITKRKLAEKDLRESEEQARQLAQENAIMAEIGKIISSTLDIKEVYERFASEARKLISFDRIAVTINNYEENTAAIAYVSGKEVPDRQTGSILSMDSSFNKKMASMRSGLLLQTEDIDKVKRQFPSLLTVFQAGFRSMMSVPLVSKDQTIGGLHFWSIQSSAYGKMDLRLAESIGSQIAGAIANAQLFIEREQMEEVLRESEERFRELYDHAPLGYHEYNAEGRITSVNRTGLEMLGYTAEEMIGQFIWKFNMEEEIVRQQILAKLAGTLPLPRNLERNYRKKDGTVLPVLIEDRLILDEKGQIKGIRCAIQDITERKLAEEERQRLEERLSRAEKMEALGTLAGGVAHDLNNVLGVLVGYSELVLMEIGEGNPLR
jgi:PAS domain S-box-containing protein